MDKVTYIGKSMTNTSEKQRKGWMAKKEAIKKTNNTKDEFKKMLRDQELYAEIKVRLRDANTMLNHSKLNGINIRSKIIIFCY